MKILLSFFLILTLSSCQKNKEDQTSFLIKYGSKEVYTAEFINKMMTLGFVKYGKNFYSRIYEQDFFEQMRAETLEHILNNIFMNRLSQKFELKITNKDVQDWLAKRAPVYSKEDLILTLQANNLTYKDWTNLFREQLVQHRIAQKLNNNVTTEKVTKKEKRKKITHYKIAVLTFENQLDADQTYKKIGSSKDKFNKTLKSLHGSTGYSWLVKEEIPFFSQIKRLIEGRISKPFETDWGFLIVRLAEKTKKTAMLRGSTASSSSPEYRALVEDFKKDPKLQINTDLLYSLKIKR